jgi:hypothetical protein
MFLEANIDEEKPAQCGGAALEYGNEEQNVFLKMNSIELL